MPDAAAEPMTIIEPNGMADMARFVGQPLGPSPWLTITQEMLNVFADATGDHAWFHIDTERAKRELPYGDTIAHGLFTLALTPKMWAEMVRVQDTGRALNYGYDKVRFLAPVVNGDRIRMRGEVAEVQPRGDGGVLVRMRMTVEIEGKDKPALVMDWMEVAWP